MWYDFASDNTAGWCPEARDAIDAAQRGAASPYGDDDWTARAADAVRQVFETDCDVYFVFNGTAANALALSSLCQPYHSIICHELAHVETDECGATEFFSNGAKLWLAGGADGRIDHDAMRELATRRTDVHYPKPQVLSVTQPTELGTVYDPTSLAEMVATATDLGMRVHMDGARFANAVASLGCDPADLTWRIGVDVLCLGGVKNGMGMGEAVVFFDRALSAEFAYRCKQAGQLASKMRFLAAPWATMLTSGSWLHHARHANRMAELLAGEMRKRGVGLAYPVEANAVFARLDPEQRQGLADRGWQLYDFIGGATRFICSWSTTDDQVAALVADLEET
ncbi:MAG: threonine aldolase family protein [Acidimicrobiales bacterium]